MRGNSGFLRLAVIGCLLVCFVSGGPPRPRRMMRETFSSSAEESVPMSFNITQDTDMCTHNGKEVIRSSVTCDKKNGCREIETHGECCPRFLCECKLNGTIYDNGDKIVDPENPCEVCVCRGGDINCNALKCYSRNDCKNVTFTPGVCCPEYTNCPPLENVELNSSNETTTTEHSTHYEAISSTISSIETSTPLLTTTTTTAQISTQSNENPIGIKIKEITKPEEIRITDDRPKIFKTIKSSETKGATTLTLYHPDTIIEPEHSQEYYPEHEASLAIIADENSEIQQEIEPEIEQHTTFSFDGSADQPIELESTDLNTVGDVSMGPKIVRQTGNGIEDEVHTTIAPLSSETESKDDILTTRSDHVTDEAPVESTYGMHNNSVLQVGDSVVIFDRSGQTQSIPLRVAGLQRGEDTYDEEDENKEGRKSDETVQNSTPDISEISSTETIFEHSTTTEVYEVYYYEPKDLVTVSLDFPSGEINTASDEGFIDGIKLNDDLKEGSADPQNVVTSSEKPLEEDSSGYAPLENFTDQLSAASTVYEKILSKPSDYDLEGSSSTTDEIFTNTDNFASSISPSQFYSSEPPTTTSEDDDIVQHDQNINFPHITDDLSIHGSRMEDVMEDDGKLRFNSRLVEHDRMAAEIDRMVAEYSILKENTNRSTVDPLESLKENNTFNDVEGRSPGEPLLIPEWERNHTTVDPIELFNGSNETTHEHLINLLAELSSHTVESVVDNESTTNQPDLSTSTDVIETLLNPSTSEIDQNYDVESIESQTSDPKEIKEKEYFNLFFDHSVPDRFRFQ